MSTAFVECWKCDECGHRWIKGETWPSHCASSKCRKRSWNKNGGIVQGAELPTGGNACGVAATCSNQIPIPNSTFEYRKRIALETMASLTSREAIANPEPVEFCRYRDKPNDSGDILGCGLPIGHKGLHGRFRKVGDIWE